MLLKMAICNGIVSTVKSNGINLEEWLLYKCKIIASWEVLSSCWAYQNYR